MTPRTDKQRAFVHQIRAEAALIAYTTALDYVHRLPHGQIVQRLKAKIEQKQKAANA